MSLVNDEKFKLLTCKKYKKFNIHTWGTNEETICKSNFYYPITTYQFTQITHEGPLVNNYRCSLRLIFKIMMSKKAFFIEYRSALILSAEIKYHTFWALCLKQSISRTLISSRVEKRVSERVSPRDMHIIRWRSDSTQG